MTSTVRLVRVTKSAFVSVEDIKRCSEETLECLSENNQRHEKEKRGKMDERGEVEERTVEEKRGKERRSGGEERWRRVERRGGRGWRGRGAAGHFLSPETPALET